MKSDKHDKKKTDSLPLLPLYVAVFGTKEMGTQRSKKRFANRSDAEEWFDKINAEAVLRFGTLVSAKLCSPPEIVRRYTVPPVKRYRVNYEIRRPETSESRAYHSNGHFFCYTAWGDYTTHKRIKARIRAKHPNWRIIGYSIAAQPARTKPNKHPRIIESDLSKVEERLASAAFPFRGYITRTVTGRYSTAAGLAADPDRAKRIHAAAEEQLRNSAKRGHGERVAIESYAHDDIYQMLLDQHGRLMALPGMTFVPPDAYIYDGKDTKVVLDTLNIVFKKKK